MLDLLAASFFLRYRARPGHFFGSIGLVLGALGALVMGYLGLLKLGYGEDIGHRPLLFIGILLCIASIQLLTTGVLAELLSRTFFESSAQPHHAIAWQSDPATAGWRSPDPGETP